jgi:hypothetical protein
MGDIADDMFNQMELQYAYGTPSFKGVDSMRNMRSAKRPVQPKEEVIMTNNNERTMDLTNVQIPKFIAVVEFLNNTYSTKKQYDFHCNLFVREGDIVVVDTVNGLQLAEVVGVKTSSAKAGKWVVDKVEVDAYRKRLEAEKKQATLKKKMEERAKKINEMERYRQLASNDPEMARMLQEYHQTESTLTGLIWNEDNVPTSTGVQEIHTYWKYGAETQQGKTTWYKVEMLVRTDLPVTGQKIPVTYTEYRKASR